MRKLVTLQTIDKLTPIEGADKIELAHIRGWTIVVSKGEFYEGQQVFYFEPDSMLPLDRGYFTHLAKYGITAKNGHSYHRLKTMKLRGQISQGLIFPYTIFYTNPLAEIDEKGTPHSRTIEGNPCSPYLDPDRCDDKLTQIMENGGDFSDYFGVIKYELPDNFIRNNTLPFPAWLSKTDETRIQSLDQEVIDQILQDKENYYPTEKIDGTSCTIYCRILETGIEEYGVCSRNQDLKDKTDAFWKLAQKKQLSTKLYNQNPISLLDFVRAITLQEAHRNPRPNTVSCVIQGEVFGGKIQNNPLKQEGIHIRLFNLFINGSQLCYTQIKEQYPEILQVWVPIHSCQLPDTVEEIIKQPDGVKSLIPGAEDCQIEGFVWRNYNTSTLYLPDGKPIKASFKAISNNYLLKHE